MPETLAENHRASVAVRRAAIVSAERQEKAPRRAKRQEKAPRRAKRQEKAPRRALRTADAARYLGLSCTLLRKYRRMGPDDPGVHGPAFIKVSHNIVLYEVAALDDWLDARKLAALERNARS